MKKSETITFRCTPKNLKMIENIKNELIKKGFNEELLSNSRVIRECIYLTNEKLKYFIYTFDKGKNKKQD